MARQRPRDTIGGFLKRVARPDVFEADAAAWRRRAPRRRARRAPPSGPCDLDELVARNATSRASFAASSGRTSQHGATAEGQDARGVQATNISQMVYHYNVHSTASAERAYAEQLADLARATDGRGRAEPAPARRRAAPPGVPGLRPLPHLRRQTGRPSSASSPTTSGPTGGRFGAQRRPRCRVAPADRILPSLRRRSAAHARARSRPAIARAHRGRVRRTVFQTALSCWPGGAKNRHVHRSARRRRPAAHARGRRVRPRRRVRARGGGGRRGQTVHGFSVMVECEKFVHFVAFPRKRTSSSCAGRPLERLRLVSYDAQREAQRWLTPAFWNLKRVGPTAGTKTRCAGERSASMKSALVQVDHSTSHVVQRAEYVVELERR